MEALRNINEALTYLKQGEIITSSGKDRFVLKNEKVCRYDEGTRFILNIEDFISLYGQNRFYLLEETAEIDETKDEAYYRYYRK
ncbi:MAG: hypothetical protein IJI46_10940 [Erysipelotrichaceae bacterium]|nr:hypothetical protein [Erysipelotrichaceae bacterium]